jgi:hypothetical protein
MSKDKDWLGVPNSSTFYFFHFTTYRFYHMTSSGTRKLRKRLAPNPLSPSFYSVLKEPEGKRAGRTSFGGFLAPVSPEIFVPVFFGSSQDCNSSIIREAIASPIISYPSLVKCKPSSQILSRMSSSIAKYGTALQRSMVWLIQGWVLVNRNGHAFKDYCRKKMTNLLSILDVLCYERIQSIPSPNEGFARGCALYHSACQ